MIRRIRRNSRSYSARCPRQRITNTLNCKASAHAARQSCALNGLYDTCGVGFEFAQVPDGDAGANVLVGDAGIPTITVPFDRKAA